MSEITKSDAQKPAFSIFWPIFVLIVVVSYLTGLGIPLLGPDEPRYTQVAREMFERGDFITPTLGGFHWFEKPALLYWLQIASFHLFGVSEFAARFGSAMFGLGTILSIWFCVRSDESAYSRDFAKIAALIAASSFGLIAFSRGASFDIILTFPIAAALTFFYAFDARFRRDNSVNYAFLAGFYIFVGVALIAKGLVGAVFPFAIVGFYYVLSRRMPPRAFVFSLIWGAILSLAVAASWYLPMYRVNGWKFIDEFFIQHHFQRYTSNKYLHPQPFHFFFWVLPLMTLPWMPFLLRSLWKMFRGVIDRIRGNDVAEDRAAVLSPLGIFAFAWMSVPLAFFSLSGSKLPGYILPAVPGALILTAFGVEIFATSEFRKRIVRFLAVAILIGAGVIARFFVTDFLHEETVKHMMDVAAEKGHGTERVFMLHTVSHSAEFYAAGRLDREESGKQKKLFGVSEVISEMNAVGDSTSLVMIPLEYIQQITKSDQITAEILDDNGELALVFVTIR